MAGRVLDLYSKRMSVTCGEKKDWGVGNAEADRPPEEAHKGKSTDPLPGVRHRHGSEGRSQGWPSR